MGEVRTGLSALRNEETTDWWRFVADGDEQERAPEFLLPLLRGEVKRVRATREQIAEALSWAESMPGWEPVRGVKSCMCTTPIGDLPEPVRARTLRMAR